MTQMTGYQTKAIVTTIHIRATHGAHGELECDADDMTIRGRENTVVDIPEFGFKDFELDLSCLSNPPSPEPSLAETRHLTPSPPPPSSPSVRSISFAHSPPPTSLGRSPTKLSMSRLSPMPGSSVPRGSWPLMKYMGRGTPIDRSRRIEWSGTGDDVGEDGLLMSNGRSTSLYSAARLSQRSISPEWHDVTPSRHSSTLPARSRSRTFASQPAIEKPQIKLEGLSSDNSEWTSFMQTVLDSSTESTPATASASASTSNLPISVQDRTPEDQPEILTEPLTLALSPEEVRQLDTGIEMDLGINEALDLGLGTRGGMNWFALGLLPASGRESPSVYSSAIQTPPVSRPPSVSASEHRSTASTKAEPDGMFQLKSACQPWWKKMLGKLRNVRFIGGPRQ